MPVVENVMVIMFNSSITGRYYPILKLALFGYVFGSSTRLHFDGKFGQGSPSLATPTRNPPAPTLTQPLG